MKFIIHPGYIESRYDGDTHFISYGNLIDLYKLNRYEFMSFRDSRILGLSKNDELECVHLYPREKGDYEECLKLKLLGL